MFFYLKPTGWEPKEDTFHAIKTAGALHPCTYQSDAKKGKYEAFIRGTGWKKSKNATVVPVYKGTTIEQAQAYMNEHGKYCLFYSITGKHLHDDDCVIWAMKQEFNVAVSLGFEYVENFCKRVNDLNQKIYKIVMDKYKLDIFSERFQYVGGEKGDGRLISKDLFQVKPCYSMMAYFLTKPHVDVINDDSKLWKHYVAIHGVDYIDANPNEFPVSMKQRLEFLFSKEVSEEYENIMKEFQMV
ncbi:MAG: hypothetical protein AABY15_06645 [Nanoarchaeota archaeon]